MKLFALFLLVNVVYIPSAHGLWSEWIGFPTYDSMLERLENAQRGVQQMVQESIEKLQNYTVTVQEITDDINAQLQNASAEVKADAAKRLAIITELPRARLRYLQTFAGKKDVSACEEKILDIIYEADEAESLLDQCLKKKFFFVTDSFGSIQKDVNQTLESLNDINEEGQKCVKEASGVLMLPTGLKCIAQARTKATWVVSKKIPAVVFNLGYTKSMSYLLPKVLPNCIPANYISHLTVKSRKLNLELKRCIRNAPAITTTTKATTPSTTEATTPSTIEVTTPSTTSSSASEATNQSPTTETSTEIPITEENIVVEGREFSDQESANEIGSDSLIKEQNSETSPATEETVTDLFPAQEVHQETESPLESSTEAVPEVQNDGQLFEDNSEKYPATEKTTTESFTTQEVHYESETTIKSEQPEFSTEAVTEKQSDDQLFVINEDDLVKEDVVDEQEKNEVSSESENLFENISEKSSVTEEATADLLTTQEEIYQTESPIESVTEAVPEVQNDAQLFEDNSEKSPATEKTTTDSFTTQEVSYESETTIKNEESEFSTEAVTEKQSDDQLFENNEENSVNDEDELDAQNLESTINDMSVTEPSTGASIDKNDYVPKLKMKSFDIKFTDTSENRYGTEDDVKAGNAPEQRKSEKEEDCEEEKDEESAAESIIDNSSEKNHTDEDCEEENDADSLTGPSIDDNVDGVECEEETVEEIVEESTLTIDNMSENEDEDCEEEEED